MRRKTKFALLAAALLVAGAASAQAQPGVVTPPRVVHHADAVYPEEALHQNVDATVVLFVTVGADGKVTDVSVVEAGGHGLDEAAIEAVRKWEFEPARRDGVAISSRIRVPFHFAPPHDLAPAPAPSPAPPSSPASPTTPAPGAAPGPEAPAPEVPGIAGGVTDTHSHAHAAAPQPSPAPAPAGGLEVSVVGGRAAAPPRTTSEFILDPQLARSAPRATATDVLKSAPGFYVAQPEGAAGPPEIFVRGFDAEHGRDLEIWSAGIPMNQPSHVHAHGYAEQRGIMPETVRSVRVREGVFDPRQGDFGVAGSIEYELGVAERGVRLSTTYGQYRTSRVAAVWAPVGEAEETFAGFSYGHSAGITPERAYDQAMGVAQYALPLGVRARAIVHASTYLGRSSMVGVVRQDDLDAGRVSFGQAYDDPSARSQGAATGRSELSVALEGVGENGSRYGVTPFVALTSFELRENFTGYTVGGPTAFADGRADLYDERNRDTTIGATAYYRTEHVNVGEARTRFELGTLLRHDLVEQADDLLFADRSGTWKHLVDAGVTQSNVGGYADADVSIAKVIEVRGGARADVIAQSVNDRLAVRRAGALPGVRADGLDAVFSPRVSVEASPLPFLRATAAYGQGFRSAPARLLVSTGSAPVSKVHSMEAGVALGERDGAVDVSLTGFRTTISSDLEFDPTTGTMAPVGPTARNGATLYLKAKIDGWLAHATSATYSRAVLVDPPASAPGEPVQSAGDPVPFVPPLVLRSDTTLSHALFSVSGRPLVGSIGSAQTFLSSRPLPGGTSLPPVFLLDATASARWGAVEAGVSAENVVGTRYVDHAFVFASTWSPTRATPDAARHVVPGMPRTVLATLTLHL